MGSPVLIVDDDPMLQKLLGAHLGTAGYQVVEASSGAAGLEVLRNGGPRIAFVDYDMPGMNGVEFCRQVRADQSIPFAHLVILTAHVDRALTIAALDAGANDFMTKPFHRGELLARLRAGERTVRLHDEAAQSIRLESERNHLRDAVTAMEHVLAVVAHELRTPIAAMGMMTEYLLKPAARGTEEWERFLVQVNEGIHGLSITVNELLEAARLNSGEANWNWSKFDLEPICKQAVLEAQSQAAVGVVVSATVEPATLACSGDASAVRRLLLNLLSNSVKYTTNGTIRVHAQGCVRDGHDWIELTVADTGAGIPLEILGWLGEPFYCNAGIAGAKHVRGMGLGIAICKRIIEAHGGRLTINSTPGAGTTVSATLRADLQQPAAPTTAQAPCESTPLPQINATPLSRNQA
jgi:signal transduction histidine kinase